MKTLSLFNTTAAFFASILLSGTLSAQTIDPAQDPAIESNTKVFLNALNTGGGKPLEQLSPKDARAVLTGAQESAKVDVSVIEVSEKMVKSEGLDVKLTIVRPAGLKSKLPVFMFFHGGGWVLGDFQTHKRIVRDLVVNSGTVAVFVNYTPSPEAHYPVAITRPMPLRNG